MRRPRYRPWLRLPRLRRRMPSLERGRGLLLSAVLGIGLAMLVIAGVDAALRPAVSTLARVKAENVITGIINDTVAETLSAEAVAYQDLVTLERNDAGQVTLLAANSARLNALRTEILGGVLDKVNSLDNGDLGIPLGNLTGLSTASGWGPDLPVQVLTVAAPSAEFQNLFTSEGINQTLHQIMLEVQVDITLLIPGGTVETQVSASVCVAETLLVGEVPDTYLELPAAGS